MLSVKVSILELNGQDIYDFVEYELKGDTIPFDSSKTIADRFSDVANLWNVEKDIEVKENEVMAVPFLRIGDGSIDLKGILRIG